MRIAMSLNEDKGENSEIALHPGNAKFIAVYDSEKKELKIIPIEQIEGCSPIVSLMKLKANIFYCFEIGMRAEELCKEKGIKLKTGSFKTVKKVIDNLNKLEDLTEGCGH